MAKKKEDLEEVLAYVKQMLEEVIGKPKPWEPWMDQFLIDLERNGGNVSAAIELCPRCRDTVYKRRKQNVEFFKRWMKICNGKERPQEMKGRSGEEANDGETESLPSP